ncbi:MAG: FAD-binding oxidoreductase [Dokdonella sp.]
MPGTRQPRGYALAELQLTTFDRQFSAVARVQRPDRYRLIDALPDNLPRIARGSGVSYVAASFGNGAISQDMSAFDRLLAFDNERGLLHVEAGARIGDVERFLLRHGWYLPIAPGHPAATIGGCIAADVHGKNPARDGTFRNQVEAIELCLPGAGVRIVAADDGQDLFDATCGGFGLTGTIVSATLRLAHAPEALAVRSVPVANLAEAAQVMREAANVPLLYGWHDGRAKCFGRGVIRIGLETDAPTRRSRHAADLPVAIKPMAIPMWNRAGIASANRWLGMRWCKPGQTAIALADALFPLNDARRYFAGFGHAGFVEAQWLIGHARFASFAGALAELVARMRPRISLIASKLFAGNPVGLSFDGTGIALAIQLPAPMQTRQQAFLEALAECAIAHGGRPNLIKQSTLDASTVRTAITGFDSMREHLRSFAIDGLPQSELTRRINL